MFEKCIYCKETFKVSEESFNICNKCFLLALKKTPAIHPPFDKYIRTLGKIHHHEGV